MSLFISTEYLNKEIQRCHHGCSPDFRSNIHAARRLFPSMSTDQFEMIGRGKAELVPGKDGFDIVMT